MRIYLSDFLPEDIVVSAEDVKLLTKAHAVLQANNEKPIADYRTVSAAVENGRQEQRRARDLKRDI